MRRVILSFIFTSVMACGLSQKSRHSDTSNLERPPWSGETHAGGERASKEQIDNVATKEDSDKGLYSDVYLVEDHDKEIRIKRNFEESWDLMYQAFRLNQIKTVRKNRKQGIYEVAYKSRGFLDDFGLFGSSRSATYQVKLEGQSNETKVSVSQVDEDDGDLSRLKDGAPDYSYDSSSKLIKLLYETLRKEVPVGELK